MTTKTAAKNGKPMSTKSENGLLVTVDGKQWLLPLKLLAYTQISPDPKNPRYGYLVLQRGAQTTEQMREHLNREEATTKLRKSIEANQGLVEPIVVKKDSTRQSAEYIAKEGNRRWAAWGQLYKANEEKGKDNPWAFMPTFVVPDDMPNITFSKWLGVVHGQGKTPWGSYEKSLYVKSLKDQGLDEDEISKLIGLSKGEITRHFEACNHVEEYGKFTDDKKPQDKFWHFYELEKLGKEIKEDPQTRDAIYELIKEGKFKDSKDLRQLPQIVTNPKAYKALINGDKDDAFDRALNVIRKEAPESIKGGVFRMLEKATEALAADFKDVFDQLGRPKGKGYRLFFNHMREMMMSAKKAGILEKVEDLLKSVKEEKDDEDTAVAG